MGISLISSRSRQISDELSIKSKKESLEEYLNEVDDAINNERQLTYPIVDKEFMVEFLSLANERKHDLNAYYCDSPVDMTNKIKRLLNENKSSARFVVNQGHDGIHFSAFEFLKINDKLSIVGIEPATRVSWGPFLLQYRSMITINREFPDASFLFIETDLQRSNGDCGMFSLFLVKKMLKEKSCMLRIHEKNISGNLKTNDGVLDKNEADNLIPPSFMKHTQSPSRLESYLNANPSTQHVYVNKKGETLKERQARNIVSIDAKGKKITYSRSIELKRKTEIEALIDTLKHT